MCFAHRNSLNLHIKTAWGQTRLIAYSTATTNPFCLHEKLVKLDFTFQPPLQLPLAIKPSSANWMQGEVCKGILETLLPDKWTQARREDPVSITAFPSWVIVMEYRHGTWSCCRETPSAWTSVSLEIPLAELRRVGKGGESQWTNNGHTPLKLFSDPEEQIPLDKGFPFLASTWH